MRTLLFLFAVAVGPTAFASFKCDRIHGLQIQTRLAEGGENELAATQAKFDAERKRWHELKDPR